MFIGIHNNKTPFVVAGPCSAESYDQLSAVTTALAHEPKVSLIRCGVWKPRTRPGGFEGAGEEALRWISRIKQSSPTSHPLPFAVEVAQPHHVELALRYGIDVLWIGARTSGSPFSMAELCQSLRGTHIPVMVKNPLVPDVKLWLGAFERLAQVGITDVAAIHRGFATHTASQLRNDPRWEVPIELRRTMPELPLLCDPSHLGGHSHLIQSLSQQALNMDFDGLMVECHCTPHTALTDAPQQVTPQELSSILSALSLPQHHDAASADLRIFREQIATIDDELISLLASRLRLSEQIADIKRASNISIYQPRQWDLKLQQCLDKAAQLGVNQDFIRDIYSRIHLQSIQVQEDRNNK